MKGRIKYYNSDKGFGFILPEEGEDIFFHISSVRSVGTITPGMIVEFDTETGTKGLKAKNVRLIEEHSTAKPKFFSFDNENIRISNIRSFNLREDRYAYRLNGGHNPEGLWGFFFHVGREYHNEIHFPTDSYPFGFDAPRNDIEGRTLSDLTELDITVEWFIVPILEVFTFKGNNYSFFDLNAPEKTRAKYEELAEYMS